MEMRTIKICKINDLSDEVKEKVIDRNREINLDFDWWEFSLENLAEEIKDKVNIDLDSKEFQFDLFSKGSHFSINSDILERALRTKYPYIEDLNLRDNVGISCYMGRFRQTEIERDDFEFEDIDEDMPELKKAVVEKLQEQKREEIEQDIYKVLELFEKAYKELYNEYEYNQSDKAIIETIEANEYEFLEDGTRI